MKGRDTVDTARCAGCAIYTPTTDVVLAADGRPYCLSCGPPPATAARPVSTRHASEDEWIHPPKGTPQQHARLVAALMLLVTLAFPLAACVSQL